MRKTVYRTLPAILFAYIIAFAGVALSARAQTTAPNEWTWVGGSNTVNSGNGHSGVYGRLGTATADNIPGGRDNAATWIDAGGNFWLFGGQGLDADGNFGGLNDLWEYNPSTNQWTWMGGSSTVPSSCATSTTTGCGQPGVYGTLASAAAANIPGGRVSAAAWADSSGNFWLFGGIGFDASQNFGELNDLWEFNPATKEWTWMGGSSTVGSNGGQPGVYGTLGSAAAANIPGGRDSAAAWTDATGNFWLFGGEGADANGDFALLDDVWEFAPTTNEWTWMGGSSTLPAACANTTTYHCGWPTVYGTLGTAAPGIGPGSRVAPATWTDKDGNFWLFGGLDAVFWENDDFSWVDQYDLWEFDPSTKQWAWMGGNSTTTCSESSGEVSCSQTGVYGTQGIPGIGNIPASRDIAIAWTDSTGDFWLFGGVESATNDTGGICNDFWVYEPAANEWAWMAGNPEVTVTGLSCSDITPGTYGVKGIPAAANLPSGRVGSARWTDSSGNLWLFGGNGYANGAGFNNVYLNDLWVYQPAAPAPEPSFEVIASPNPINIAATGPGTSTITTGTTTVSVLVADGFDSPVILTAATDTMNGVIDITGSFSPGTLTGSGSSTLTISVTGAAVMIAEPIPLTITATSGSNSQTTQVIVDVTEVGQISAPTFSVPAGTYSTPQTVSLIGTPYIYYTTNGSTPTASSAVYVNPISVASTTTLKAIAIDGFSDQSAVSSATYTIAAAAPNFSIAGTSVSVAPGATTGNTSTITFTPSDGFTGVINLSCAITPTAASDPATCGIPASVTISGSAAQTITLTVNTTSPSSAFDATGEFFLSLAGVAAVPSILLICIPAQRRRSWSMLAMLLLILCIFGSAMSCGGGGSGGGDGGNPGTTPGAYVITVTGTSGTLKQEGTVSLSVQ